MRFKIGFEYEQASIEDADRCRGLYIWDEETGLVVAIVEGRWVQAKVYDNPSSFGVNNCRVSKIAISKTGSHEQGIDFFEQMCYNYDRGLDFHDKKLLPDSLLQKILEQLNGL